MQVGNELVQMELCHSLYIEEAILSLASTTGKHTLSRGQPCSLNHITLLV